MLNNLLKQPFFKAYLALIIVYLVWGTTFGAIHIGVQTIPPAILACLRFLVAGSLLLGFCLIKGEPIPSRTDLKKHLIIGFFLFFAGNSLVCWSLQFIPTGLGAALTAINPFIMVWLSAVIPPQEKTPPQALLGFVLGVIGLLILLSPELMRPETVSRNFWWSVLIILPMAVCWCIGSIYARKFSPGNSLLMSIAWQNLFAGMMLIPVYLLATAEDFRPSEASVAALAYLIVMGSMIAMTCYYYALQRLPIAIIGTIAYVTPVITLLFGWIFLDEALTVTSITGIAIILTGIFIVQNAHQADQTARPAQLLQPIMKGKD
jgi:drug/metabolite transporter (DMT)-like permease